MSVREEDRKKSGCPSRGVAIAATALGVGLGAAFYYLFNKRQETPNSEGSSSHWNDEPPPFLSYSDDSYTTISENETTDTSMNSQSESSSDTSRTNSDFTTDDYSTSDSEMVDSDEFSTSRSTIDMDELSPDNTSADISQDGDWDVTRSSAGLPTLDESIRSSVMVVFENVRNVFSPRVEKTQDQTNQLTQIRQEAFRQRGWTLEECSICFDVMLRNQEITSLPCAHNFHTECILPWLQEKQTCPNCRKVAE